MTITHYTSSKGSVEIATMPLRYATNALEKLRRERVDTTRDAEIDALAAHVATLSEEATDTPPPAPEPTRGIGDNNPPETTPYEGIKAHIDDLYEEAKPWLTGAEIATEEQAAEIKRLKDDFTKAHKIADDARIAENEPFDKGKAAVQAKYAPLISDTKAVKGKTVLALATLNEVLTKYLNRKDVELRAAAQKAREEAEAAAKAAQDAARAAVGDLEAKEEAEDLINAAAAAEAAAKQAEKARPQVHGDGRASGLRSYWKPVVTDAKKALLHYMVQDRLAFLSLIQSLAERDVREGKRTIPGFDVIEERRVA